MGLIDLCICDKTGTLTKNELTLAKIYTDNKIFSMQPLKDRKSKEIRFTQESVTLIREHLNSSEVKNAENMFYCMALCHTAVVSEHKGGTYGEYISESEDELTLINSAK